MYAFSFPVILRLIRYAHPLHVSLELPLWATPSPVLFCSFLGHEGERHSTATQPGMAVGDHFYPPFGLLLTCVPKSVTPQSAEGHALPGFHREGRPHRHTDAVPTQTSCIVWRVSNHLQTGTLLPNRWTERQAGQSPWMIAK